MTEQEYKEICKEVRNSGIPVPSQQKIIDACGKQVVKEVRVGGYAACFLECSVCGKEVQAKGECYYCPICGQKLRSDENEVN